jgi:MtaA/CmuA family methyltransferase
MGAKVSATDDNQPFGGIGEPLVRSAADIDRIPAPDVGTQARYPLMIEALSRVVEALGKEVIVVACFDQYPFSLAAALMGISEIMLKVVDDPPFVAALMQRCSDYAAAYAHALSDAGAHMLSGGDSPAGLLSPPHYRQLALPAERRLIASIRSATGKSVSLHICGNSTPILSGMAASGADVLELDHAVDIGHACRLLGPNIALWGNLDPIRVLAQGTPESVRHKARETLGAVAATGHRRFVLSSGCTLAVKTPAENLDALFTCQEE